MIRFDVDIKLGNAAMLSPGDVADALRYVADQLAAGDAGRGEVPDMVEVPIRDANGNTVGSWAFVGDGAP